MRRIKSETGKEKCLWKPSSQFLVPVRYTITNFRFFIPLSFHSKSRFPSTILFLPSDSLNPEIIPFQTSFCKLTRNWRGWWNKEDNSVGIGEGEILDDRTMISDGGNRIDEVWVKCMTLQISSTMEPLQKSMEGSWGRLIKQACELKDNGESILDMHWQDSSSFYRRNSNLPPHTLFFLFIFSGSIIKYWWINVRFTHTFICTLFLLETHSLDFRSRRQDKNEREFLIHCNSNTHFGSFILTLFGYFLLSSHQVFLLINFYFRSKMTKWMIMRYS